MWQTQYFSEFHCQWSKCVKKLHITEVEFAMKKTDGAWQTKPSSFQAYPKIKAYINATVTRCQSGDTDYWCKYFGIVRFFQVIPWRGIGDYIMSQTIMISWDTLYKTWHDLVLTAVRVESSWTGLTTSTLQFKYWWTFQTKHPVLFVTLQTTRNVCQGIHCHYVIIVSYNISIG